MLHSASYVPGALNVDPNSSTYYVSGRHDKAQGFKFSSFVFNPNASAFVPRGPSKADAQTSRSHGGNGELATLPNEVREPLNCG